MRICFFLVTFVFWEGLSVLQAVEHLLSVLCKARAEVLAVKISFLLFVHLRLNVSKNIILGVRLYALPK